MASKMSDGIQDLPSSTDAEGESDFDLVDEIIHGVN